MAHRRDPSNTCPIWSMGSSYSWIPTTQSLSTWATRLSIRSTVRVSQGCRGRLLNSFHFVSEFARIIRDEVGSDSKIVHKPAVEDDPKRRRPNISLAKKVLNWEPRVPLQQGLQKTIEYFRRELSRKNLSDGSDVHPNEYQVFDKDNMVESWKPVTILYQNWNRIYFLNCSINSFNDHIKNHLISVTILD